MTTARIEVWSLPSLITGEDDLLQTGAVSHLEGDGFAYVRDPRDPIVSSTPFFKNKF